MSRSIQRCEPAMSKSATGLIVRSFNNASSPERAVSPRFLLTLALSIVGISFAAAAGIAIADPYGVSPFGYRALDFNINKLKRVDIDRQLKPYEVWRYQPETIFIGTSRVNQSLDPAALDGSRFG